MDQKNFVIGILSTTAVILFVGVMIIHTQSTPAVASGLTATSGTYVLTVGTFTRNDEELVYVIDAEQAKMIVYRFDTGKGQIETADAIDLAEMRAAGAAPAAKTSTSQRGRRP